MALDSFRSRSLACLPNAERCAFFVKANLVQSHRLVSMKRLRAMPARGHVGDRILTGFSMALEESSFGKRRTREGCLISRHNCRSHGFITICAKSTSGAQVQASKYPCMYVKGTVSSGEVIQYPGTVVVLGDVQAGAAIMADGDIVVLGRLHGDVHGGQNGDRGAVVYATHWVDACHIRVADAVVSKLPFPECPVIASVQGDGTLGFRAAVQGFGDNKVSSTSRGLLYSAAVTEPLKSSEDQASSKRPAQLALFTGLYIGLVGMALLVFPTSLFGVLFDVRSVTVGWIRVGAILAMVFGVYYIGTAVGDMRGSSGARAFYMSTVVGRVFLFFSFCWLVAVGAAQRALLLLGIVNMLGAMSMLVALRQDSKARVSKLE